MPSGRDSFRRNRVAPSVQSYFSTSARLLGVCPLDHIQVVGECLQSLGKTGDRVPCNARPGPLLRFL